MSEPGDGDAPAVWISTACARAPRALGDVLERYLAAGLRDIELSAPHPPLPPAELVTLLEAARARGARFLLHNYFPAPAEEIVLNLASTDPRVLQRSHALVANALALAARLGAPLYACHTGYRADAVCREGGRFAFAPLAGGGESEAYAQLLESLEQILERPEVVEGRVAFAIENLFPEREGPNPSFCCTPDEIASLLDRFESERLGLLLDLGHLDISANLLGFDRDKALDFLLRWYPGRIREVHLSANDRERDLHRPLAPGDWPLEVVRQIHEATRPCGGTHFAIEARGLEPAECRAQVERVRRALG